MTLWFRRIASQEALHERGINYKQDFLELQQATEQLMLGIEVMAVRLDTSPALTLQLKDMQLDNAPEFSSTSFRRYHHYMQLVHHQMLLNIISERFITLETHANTVWR